MNTPPRPPPKKKQNKTKKKQMMEMVRNSLFEKKHQVSEEDKPETVDIVPEGYTTVFSI